MKKIFSTLFVLALSGYTMNVLAFCGFYVAKADAKLFNKTSQVILVRDGDQSVITMSSDFSGPLDEFAMVVPVPQVLERNQIKTVSKSIFDKLDAYSAPRMAEYYDNNPCWEYEFEDKVLDYSESEKIPMNPRKYKESNKLGVTVEAKYQVGEYDILILSAEKSAGLETWLIKNDYKIPAGAKEVLEPYIKSDMKFFVVKVNMKELKKSGSEELNPIRISFKSDKFMLPIRLGMANANGDQDMIVYTFTKNGRTETTNYRTVKIPTNNEIPVFVQDNFGKFYKDAFKKAHKRENEAVTFLEYAWDVSARQYVKCDPCVGNPPVNQDLADAGVFWLNKDPMSPVFFTRLHVRYNRENFPQDLKFQITSNKERFQGRYVIRHPAVGPFECESGKTYLQGVVKRREKELHELARLTGWNINEHSDYVQEYRKILRESYPSEKTTKGEVTPVIDTVNDNNNTTPGGGTDRSLFFLFLGSVIFILLGWPILREKISPTRA